MRFKMSQQTSQRGPRGKYARTICRGCRSRKIKCVMRDQDLGPLGIPQPEEKSCERCHNLRLDCILEPTLLGRPAAKRHRGMISRDSGNVTSAGSSLQNTLLSSDIQEHLFCDTAEAATTGKANISTKSVQRTTKEELFQSMIEPHFFLSSSLAKDETFGVNMTLASSWKESLPNIVDNEVAMNFEKALIWHYFFLPSMPGLIELRTRLLSTSFLSINSATKFLFALLCITALDIDQSLDSQYSHLKPTMRSAVASLGQEFLFAPPTHPDSVATCLFLADYKPTALTIPHGLLHRAIKAETFIHLAHRISHRLEESSEQEDANSRLLFIADYGEFDAGFHKMTQNLQILYYDTFLDGYISKSYIALRRALGKIMPIVHQQNMISKHRQRSPKNVFHMGWTISAVILLDALATLKEKWKSPTALFAVIEETEKACSEQFEKSRILLDPVSNSHPPEESIAALSLLDLRFNSVVARIWGLGLLYASIIRSRSLDGRTRWQDEVESDEAIRISDQVANSRADVLAGAAEPFAMILTRLGTRYPEKLASLLDMFIKCAHLKLNGISLQPPLQHLALEIVTHCKNLVENNLVHLKCFGRLNPNFEKQEELFAKCKEKFDAFRAAPWTSTETSFTNGCVYAASSKILASLRDLLVNLIKMASRQEIKKQETDQEGEHGPGIFKADPEFSETAFMGLHTSTEAWNMWPYLGGFGPLQNPQELHEWIEGLGMVPDW